MDFKMDEETLKKAAKIFGKRGGESTKEKYGSEYFSKISKMRKKKGDDEQNPITE